MIRTFFLESASVQSASIRDDTMSVITADSEDNHALDEFLQLETEITRDSESGAKLLEPDVGRNNYPINEPCANFLGVLETNNPAFEATSTTVDTRVSDTRSVINMTFFENNGKDTLTPDTNARLEQDLVESREEAEVCTIYNIVS